MKRAALLVLGVVCATAALFSRSGHAADFQIIRWLGRTRGSPYTIQIVGTNLAPAQSDSLRTEVEQRLQEVNRQMSHYQPDSELSQFSRAPAHTPFKVSPEFARVVRFTLEIFRRSQVAFDPTQSWTHAAALFIVRESERRYRHIPSSRFAAMTSCIAAKAAPSIPVVLAR